MTLHDGGKDKQGLNITNIESVRVNYGVLNFIFSLLSVLSTQTIFLLSSYLFNCIT